MPGQRDNPIDPPLPFATRVTRMVARPAQIAAFAARLGRERFTTTTGLSARLVRRLSAGPAAWAASIAQRFARAASVRRLSDLVLVARLRAWAASDDVFAKRDAGGSSPDAAGTAPGAHEWAAPVVRRRPADWASAAAETF